MPLRSRTLAWLAALVALLSCTGNPPGPAPSSAPVGVAATSPTPASAPTIDPLTGTAGPLAIGMTAGQAIAAMGQPESQYADFLSWQGGQVTATLVNGAISKLEISASAYSVLGLHIGARLQDARQAFPTGLLGATDETRYFALPGGNVLLNLSPVSDPTILSITLTAPPTPLADPSPLPNLSQTPGTVEVNLAAAPQALALLPGLTTQGFAYNGQFPGPTLEAHEGDHVIVHFSNQLSELSNLHFHGMHIPPAQDGGPFTADLVAPGASRSYTFDVLPGTAGTYWYHPHPHGLTGEQVYKGLEGLIRVRAAHDPLPAAYGDTLVVLSDNRFAADGSFAAPTQDDHDNGRVGPEIFVNGHLQPVLKLHAGEIRRVRFVNGSSARDYKLHLPGCQMVQIGTDGGLFEHPQAVDSLLLTPSERAEVLIEAPATPLWTTMQALFYDRGTGGDVAPPPPDATLRVLAVRQSAPPLFCLAAGVSHSPKSVRTLRHALARASANQAPLPLFSVWVAGSPAAMPAVPATLRPVPPIATDTALQRYFTLDDGGALGIQINHKSFSMSRIDTEAHLGATEVWHIANNDELDHPFHLHGFEFQVLDVNGTPTPFRAWKDTVNVPHGGTVSFAVTFNDYPGDRVYHCHILQHEDMGMMGWLRIDP